MPYLQPTADLYSYLVCHGRDAAVGYTFVETLTAWKYVDTLGHPGQLSALVPANHFCTARTRTPEGFLLGLEQSIRGGQKQHTYLDAHRSRR